jgi:hypothetical protein
MNAEELIKAARRTANYQNATVKILQGGLADTWDNAWKDLDREDQDKMTNVVESLRAMIAAHGNAIRMAVTIVAFEIQIENAQERQSERNN